MDEKITEKSGFTDTGSTVFVDSSNNIPNSAEETGKNKQISSESAQNEAKNTENQGSAVENQGSAVKNTENFDTSTEKRANLLSKESKEAFSAEFPDVDIEKLCNQRNFCDFLDLVTKNPTLSQIYSCFNAITAFAESSAENRTLQALANAKSGVGALASKESGEEIYFTKEQVLKMTPDEIRRNYTKIRSSQARW